MQVDPALAVTQLEIAKKKQGMKATTQPGNVPPGSLRDLPYVRFEPGQKLRPPAHPLTPKFAAGPFPVRATNRPIPPVLSRTPRSGLLCVGVDARKRGRFHGNRNRPPPWRKRRKGSGNLRRYDLASD